jgi:hypothetical protein
MSRSLCCLFIVQVLASVLFQNNTDSNSISSAKVNSKRTTASKWGYSYFSLLIDKRIQSELDMSESQRNDLKKLEEKLFEEIFKNNPHKFNETKQQRNFDDKLDQNKEDEDIEKGKKTNFFNELSIESKRILNEEQKKRLDEIIFQLKNVEIFFYPDIVSSFHFSKSQIKEIEQIHDALIKRAAELREKYILKEKKPQEFKKQLLKCMDEGKGQFLKSFSSEQMAKFETMEGKKIDFDQTDLNFSMRRKKSDIKPDPQKE